MEDGTTKLTRFLLESARSAQKMGDRFEKRIRKLISDVERLDEDLMKYRDELNEGFRDFIFELNDVPNNKVGKQYQDAAHDVMTQYMFEDKFGINKCMAKLNEQLDLIRKVREQE